MAIDPGSIAGKMHGGWGGRRVFLCGSPAPPAAYSARGMLALKLEPSEVRRLSSGNVRLLVVVVFHPVFRTDAFRDAAGRGRIGHGGGPRRREDAFILDRQMHLQE